MEDFFFTGPLDYLLYEAELAQGSRKPITLDIRRRPVETPGETTWTGFGFKQVFEGSGMEHKQFSKCQPPVKTKITLQKPMQHQQLSISS